MSPLRCLCAALCCFAPMSGVFAAKNRVEVNPVVGDFAIIGMYGHSSFIIDSGAMVAFEVKKQSQGETKNWKIGDVIRQTVLKSTSKCELKNLTNGQVVQADPVSLSGYKYHNGLVGTLKIKDNSSEGIFLADFKHYKIVNYTPADAPKWKQADLVVVIQKNASERRYVLKNLTSGAKAEAIMTNQFQG